MPVWPFASPQLAAFRAGVDSPAALAKVPAGPPVHDLSQLLEAVALGQGIAFVPSSYATHARDARVAYVPVTDIPPSHGGVAWATASESASSREFVRAAIDVARRKC